MTTLGDTTVLETNGCVPPLCFVAINIALPGDFTVMLAGAEVGQHLTVAAGVHP